MDKYEIARALDEISRYLELSEPNRFKALAFERAARALRAQNRDVDDLIAGGDLMATPGIGKATANVIQELAGTGSSPYLDELREPEEQVAFADVILLNKTDLVTVAELDALEQRIRAINPTAALHRCQNSLVGMDKILNVNGFNLDRVLEINPHFLDADGHEHEHAEDVYSVGITIPGDLDETKLNGWLRDLLMQEGRDIFRMKGVLSIKGSVERFVFQGVHMMFDGKPDRPWGDRPRHNALIFIGKNLDRAALTEGFRACLA